MDGERCPLDGRYLRLRPDKAPVSWQTLDAGAAADWPDVGVLLPEPFVAVDVDDMAQAAALTALVEGEDIPCRIMETTRGRHFWFRSSQPVKNRTHTMTGLGITADYRSWGKKSQVCVKLGGRWRRWLRETPWDDVAELPRWLRPLGQDRHRFFGMGEGDGRNGALFGYQVDLARRGYAMAEAHHLLGLINRYMFREPLAARELAAICRADAWPGAFGAGGRDGGPPLPAASPEGGRNGWPGSYGPGSRDGTSPLPAAPAEGRESGGAVRHNELGERLREELHILCRQGVLYTWREGCYRPGENEILRAVLAACPGCKRHFRQEVLDYLSIRCHVEAPAVEEYVVNCRNGRLDLRTGRLTPHTPQAMDFQQIAAAYDPAVYVPAVDELLMELFGGDCQLYRLFEELLGDCLVKNRRTQAVFILFGEGGNGKSTLLRLIRGLVGEGNYAALTLQDLEKPFRPAGLQDKLVNLGDDIPPTTIRDSSLLKSLASGEEVTVERKNKDPFGLRSYATLIFTTNRMPSVRDKSHGFYRRLVLIPLEARLAQREGGMDPDMAGRLSTPAAMSYLLSMAVRGLRRTLRRGLTQPDRVREAVEDYRTRSSAALTWVAEAGLDRGYLLSRSTSQLYVEFRAWCAGQGVASPPQQRGFTDELKRGLGFVLSGQRREPGTGRKQRFFLEGGERPAVPLEDGGQEGCGTGAGQPEGP